MGSRYRALGVYSTLIAVGAGAWLAIELIDTPAPPSLLVVLVGVLASLFVWRFGLRSRIGLISMERVPQIGLLLVMDPPLAAAICAGASCVWPLVSRNYSHGSTTVAALRAAHNAGMTALMLLVAGEVYLAAGGRHPLSSIALLDLWPLAAMALSAQVVNIALMALWFRFDRRDVRGVVTPAYALSDLVFVPAGVLAAALFNAGELSMFALFVGVMIVFVLSFNGIGDALQAAAERGPMARLFETSRAMRGVRRVDELGERLLAETRTLFRFDEFFFVLVEREHGLLDMRIHECRGARQPSRTKPLQAGLFGWVVDRAQPLLVQNWSKAAPDLLQRADRGAKETGSVLIAPLIDSNSVIGLLSVQHTEIDVYSPADLHLITQLAQHAGPALADARAFEDLAKHHLTLEQRVAARTNELEKANKEKERLIAALRERSKALERESLEDPLTGLANRRCFLRRLAAEMEVALAVGQPLTVAVADLDHFKRVNDRYGHAVGDETLIAMAELMRNVCRPTDLIARTGGEEFTLILPGLAHTDGVEFCERLRAAVESHPWSCIRPGLEATLSVGIAQWDGGAEAEELLQAADARLYRAKRAGRNQVV